MERTAEIPQLQLVQQNDEILSPDAQSRETGEHTCPPGLKHLVAQDDVAPQCMETDAYVQGGVNPLTQEE